ncbi:MAG TPA: HEAT repeat domain-containing protein [Planctomycetes bacterium]|nr:HEAT repeat domain-containing protein [Planctomycetota bacterium]
MLASLVLLGALTCSTARPHQESETPSLESALERYRERRDAVLERLRAPVSDLVARLEASSKPGRLTLEELRSSLDQLGPEAALLLIPWVDPEAGTAPKPGDGAERDGEEETRRAARRLRADEVTAALVRMRPPGVLAPLAEIAETASPLGRRNAARVLASVPERERASALLADLFPRTSGALRLEVARGLGKVGAPPEVLRAALTDSDAEVVEAVLEALAQSGDAGAADTVLELSRDPAWGARVAEGLLAFWRRFPDRVDTEVLHTLVALALRTSLPADVRVAVLRALPEFRAAKDRSIRQELEPLARSSTASIREAALITSVLLGDRGARKALLSSFDRTIKESPDWWKGYAERGRVLLAIHDYTAAAKDLREALDRLEKRARTSTHEELWVDLARCQVRSGKLARAASTLEEMGMGREVRERLRGDPDFKPLVEHSRYGKLFD